MAITYEDIQKWSGEEMRRKRQDPALRTEIDAAIEAHNASKYGAVQVAEQETETQALARAQQDEIDAANAEAEHKVKQQEIARFMNLTPEERVAELTAKKLKEKEDERAEYMAQVAREKEVARRSIMRPEEIRAEEEAKEAAEAQAEADRAALEEAEKAKVEADAKAETDRLEAERVEAQRKELEEKARLAAEAEAQAIPKKKEKIVIDYQAEDENGKPIGRRTHIEGDTFEEVIEKQKVAHINAARYAERMKKRAEATPTPAKVEKPILVLTDAQREEVQKELESKDTTKAELARIKLDQDETNRERIDARNKAEFERGMAESNAFMKNNPEFFPCEANAKVLSDYIKEHKLEWSAGNLEIAFASEEAKFAQRPEANPPVPEVKVPTAAEVAAQEASRAQAELDAQIEAKVQARLAEIEQQRVAANTAAANASVVDSTPVELPIPAETVPAVANPPASARKLPAGGVEPGSLHGARPQSSGSKPSGGLTKLDIARMDKDTYRKKLKDPNFLKQLDALGIKI